MARRKRKWQISTESCVHSLMLSLIRTLSPETVAKCLVTILQSGLVQVSRSAPCVCWSEVVSLTYLKISAGSWLSYVLPAKVSVQDGDKIPRIWVSVPNRLTSLCLHLVFHVPRTKANHKVGPRVKVEGGSAGLRIAGGRTHWGRECARAPREACKEEAQGRISWGRGSLRSGVCTRTTGGVVAQATLLLLCPESSILLFFIVCSLDCILLLPRV